MRPARKGPENHPGHRRLRRRDDASMRPARKGPENRPLAVVHRIRLSASMRPARKGPENLRPLDRCTVNRHGFNEAGPQGAGKPQ